MVHAPDLATAKLAEADTKLREDIAARIVTAAAVTGDLNPAKLWKQQYAVRLLINRPRRGAGVTAYFINSRSAFRRLLPTFLTAFLTAARDLPLFFDSWRTSCF